MRPFHNLFALLPLLPLTHACLTYTATFPFAPSSPFEATITDNSIISCWISTAYNTHSRLQKMYDRTGIIPPTPKSPPPSKKNKLSRRSVGTTVSLTERPSLRSLSSSNSKISVPDNRGGGQLKLESEDYQDCYTADGEGEKEKEWLNWEFTCIEGYEAYGEPGLRTVFYKAHGQEWHFVPDSWEDIEAGVWRYETRLWCEDEGEEG